MTHELKCWPQYFCRVADGSKTFECRVNDRGFQPGDIIVLREWDQKLVYHAQGPFDDRHDGYTGKRLQFKIGYVLPIDEKRVVFSLLRQE